MNLVFQIQQGITYMAKEKKVPPPKEAMEEAEDQKQEITIASHSVPAPFANRAVLAMTAGGAKLTFFEQHGTDAASHPRTAVLLPFQDAIALKNLLQKMLAPIETQLAIAEAAEKAKEDGTTAAT